MRALLTAAILILLSTPASAEEFAQVRGGAMLYANSVEPLTKLPASDGIVVRILAQEGSYAHVELLHRSENKGHCGSTAASSRTFRVQVYVRVADLHWVTRREIVVPVGEGNSLRIAAGQKLEKRKKGQFRVVWKKATLTLPLADDDVGHSYTNPKRLEAAYEGTEYLLKANQTHRLGKRVTLQTRAHSWLMNTEHTPPNDYSITLGHNCLVATFAVEQRHIDTYSNLFKNGGGVAGGIRGGLVGGVVGGETVMRKIATKGAAVFTPKGTQIGLLDKVYELPTKVTGTGEMLCFEEELVVDSKWTVCVNEGELRLGAPKR